MLGAVLWVNRPLRRSGGSPRKIGSPHALQCLVQRERPIKVGGSIVVGLQACPVPRKAERVPSMIKMGTQSFFLFLFLLVLFIYLFIYFTLQYCIGFAIH